MKYLLMVLMLLTCVNANAKEFRLTYIFGKDKLLVKINAKDVNEAISQGADFCFEVLSPRTPINNRYDLIDVCANPQTILKP